MENLIPMDLEAEKRLIGSLIVDREAISDVMLKLRPDHFYSISNKYLFETICSLYIEGHPVTPETIANELKGKKELDQNRLEILGGPRVIFDTLEGVGGGEHEFWTEAVKKKSEERDLLAFADDVRRIALSSPDDIKRAKAKLEERLVSMSSENASSSVSISAASGEMDKRIDRYIDHPDDIIGMSTVFNKLDETLDCLQEGNVTIVYAPSSRFKSLFTTNIGWHLAQAGIPGLWFTTEMPRVQVLERLLQLESGLNLKWLRRDKRVYEFKGVIKSANAKLATYPIYFCDTSALDVAEVRAEVSRHTRWNGIRYILVDLVDHVSSSRFKDEMVNNQRMVMASMKQIAKDFNIHIVLVSHVSKQNEQKRHQADLDVEEMIGSAAKYQDVDASISIAPVKNVEGRWSAMQRDDILWYVSHEGKLDVMISVTKNRHGELLRTIMTLDFNHGGRFEEEWFKPIERQEALVFNED